MKTLLRYLSAITLAMTAPVAAAPPPTAVIVAEVRTDDIVDRIEALGTLRANESITLTAAVTETVTAIHFEDGDRVAAGAVVVEMTSAEEHALLEEAKATVEEARIQYNRVKSLAQQGTAARSLLDERRREWETARARLNAIKSRLADRLITVPFAGVLGLRNISVGALVEPGDKITTLDDDSLMKLDFSVPSVHLATLTKGLSVIGRANAFGDQVFEGEVWSIDSHVDPVTRTVTVRAVLPNPDRRLKPGMLMQVDLLVNPRQSLIIPEEALVPQGSRQTVLVVDTANGEKAKQRDIRIGTRRAGEVEVIEGLRAGEHVISHGAVKLRPGQPVIVRAVDDGSRPLSDVLKSLDKPEQ